MIEEGESFDQAVAAVPGHLAAGASLEEVIAFLRREGLWQFQSIRVLTRATGIGLVEAKHLIHTSATWADERHATEELTQALATFADSLEAVQQRSTAADRTEPDREGPQQPA